MEREFYPDHKEDILSTKTIEGLIAQGIAQNTLNKEGWLEKQIRARADNHLKNSKLVRVVQAKNANLKRGEPRFTTQIDRYGPDRPLSPTKSENWLVFHLITKPEFQEKDKYFRFVMLFLDFECEIHVGKNKFNALLRAFSEHGFVAAEIKGRVKEETPKGFLLPDCDITILHRGKSRKGYIPIDKKHLPPPHLKTTPAKR